jgi:hypothetical protein
MREIKFRAWDGKKMHKVGGIVFDGERIVEIDSESGDEFTEGMIAWNVMQYTGLKDKNGREIYEGDIDLCTGADGTKWVGEIKWNDESANFELINPTLGFQRAFGKSGDAHEVIGNIYENDPELLKT